ncbi:ATP-grasp domain-containing protein [Catenulispora pinisilvae]|uniref:ATP-grasp domain-containing protein n=1 Tax=Catenulispora pinisilvae TaxID=2705253 RepID=UPI0018920D0F|nr:ATP-grasp domain-containing protein [Catenulispora pinisilvae]
MPSEEPVLAEQPVRPIIFSGYSSISLFGYAEVLPAKSVIIVEESEYARERDAQASLTWSPLVREVVEWDLVGAGQADEFFLAHRDLDPVAVVPNTEVGTLFAARLAERYGLSGAGFGAARAMRDKRRLRAITGAAGIPNPESVVVADAGQARAFLAAGSGPIVLKPAAGMGSVATCVVRDSAGIDEVWDSLTQEAARLGPEQPMLAERFVAGPEFSVEMLVRGGKDVFASVTGKLLYPGSRPVEMGHVVPADIPAALTELLVQQTRRVVEAVGFADGIVHCEWIVADGVPHLVECAGRCAGAGIIDMIRQAYPVDIVQAYVDILSGRAPSVELPARARRAASVRFTSAQPGVVTAIRGVEAAGASEGVFYAGAAVEVGGRVNKLRSSGDRPAFAAVTADTPAEALRLAAAAAALIEIETRPE